MVRPGGVLLAAAVWLLGYPVLAGDPERSPEDAFRERVATFAAPGAEAGFSYQARFFMNDQDLGRCSFSAEAIEVTGIPGSAGAPAWRVRDQVELDLGAVSLEVDARAHLDAALSGLSGSRREDRNGVVRDLRWQKTATGFTVTTRDKSDGATEELRFEHQGSALNTLSALILFCRLAMPDREEYAFTVFDPGPDEARERTERAVLRFEGPGEWRGRSAYVVSGQRGDQDLSMAFDPESRDWLGLEMATRGGMAVVILPVEKPGAAEDEPSDLLDPLLATLLDPPATGMAVTRVLEGSQAMEKGVAKGDVLVSYDGEPTADLEALLAAKRTNEGRATVTLGFVRGSESLTLEFAPGTIGVDLVPVAKGVPAKPLPPATAVAIDFSSLEGASRNEWFAFSLTGQPQAGFEHGMLALADGKVVLRREVGFDGGEQWGINHFDVTVEVTAEARPRLLRTRFETPGGGWSAEGELRELADGTTEWRHRVRGGPEEESGVRSVPARKDLLAEYFVEVLAVFMPREKGACFHFRPLVESTGEPGLPAALLCAGRKEIEHEGEKVGVWRYEQHRLGGQIVSSYYVDDRGRMLLVARGGAQARLTTKEEALGGLDERIVPRTAR